jgi:hypothetical protein
VQDDARVALFHVCIIKRCIIIDFGVLAGLPSLASVVAGTQIYMQSVFYFCSLLLVLAIDRAGSDPGLGQVWGEEADGESFQFHGDYVYCR